MTSRHFAVVGLVFVAVTALVAGRWMLAPRPDPAPVANTADPSPLPPPEATRFLNTDSAVDFVGMEACIRCHQQEYDSYLLTAHSRALADINLSEEPPDGQFHHAASGRTYRAYRDGDEFRHREFLLTPTGEEVVLTDVPARYAIGSGRFSRSYLIEQDGFLVESPVTWYAARQAWAISPGYDQLNPGFERPAEIRCVNCHAGRATAQADSPQRVDIQALVIDCERCHGPGALHVARQEARNSSERTDAGDPTIVHPNRLSRERNEDICAQCHLHSVATVDVRGRSLADFRPGQRLADFAIHYGLETPAHTMEVVGHMEQMRLSRCYQQSDALTCTTCHDPHDHARPAARTDAYRSHCLSCHQPISCGLGTNHPDRLKENDNCVTCHMPTTPTEIPHFAFTHHRIAVHTDLGPPPPRPESGTLVPLASVQHLPDIEQQRCLGLAHVQWAEDLHDPQARDRTFAHARTLLGSVRTHGLRDGEVHAALARIDWQQNPAACLQFSRLALTDPDLSPSAHASALFTLASTLVEQDEPYLALPSLEKLVEVRHYGPAWSVLADCRLQSGDVNGALQAAQLAVQISPANPAFERQLAELYRLAGDPSQAQVHRQRAEVLAELLAAPTDSSAPAPAP